MSSKSGPFSDPGPADCAKRLQFSFQLHLALITMSDKEIIGNCCCFCFSVGGRNGNIECNSSG